MEKRAGGKSLGPERGLTEAAGETASSQITSEPIQTRSSFWQGSIENIAQDIYHLSGRLSHGQRRRVYLFQGMCMFWAMQNDQ